LHGGLNISYDTSITSPLQTLSTNVIVPTFLNGKGTGSFIKFSFEVYQFDINSQTGNLNQATDFTINIPLNNQYYFCRVYVQNPTTELWTEIQTTHSAEIYDINVPTASLQVITDTSTSVNVTIPQIYTGGALLNMGVRIDVYETLGPINMMLGEYNFTAFTATFEAYDENDNTIYTAPLSTLPNVIVFCDKIVTGGENALAFETLREQVITNAIGNPNIPITSAQIDAAVTDLGYNIVTNVDNITNRIFTASKTMPQPTTSAAVTNNSTTQNQLITAAAATVATVTINVANAILIDTVVNNGLSLTIMPTTLYQNVNGIVSMVSNSQVEALGAMLPEQLAVTVTAGNYMYTPFHYVLDMSKNELNLRPYYLNDPVIESKIFVDENDTTLLQVATGTYGIVTTPTGYAIQVITQSGTTFQQLPDSQVYAQLSFIPYGETSPAYLMGTLIGKSSGERIYNFDLSSTWNVDSNNNLELTSFFMFNTTAKTVLCPLNQIFDITYSTTAPVGSQWIADDVDAALGDFLLPTGIVGITLEQLVVEFGFALDTLWNRSRTVVAPQPYQTYQANVPQVYQSDIYAKNAVGATITIVNGQPVMTKLHSKGDPVFDINGNPVYQFVKGDVILDTNGAPIPVGATELDRQIDIMMIDGTYYFATDTVATSYIATLIETLVGWLTNDLETISQKLLEKTQIFFYPQITMGLIEVSAGNGATMTINANQSFVVNLTVDNTVYANTALRSSLETSTVQVLGQQIAMATVSYDAIVEALRDVYGDDVISVQVVGLGGTTPNLNNFTVVNNATQCSLAKQLIVQPDQSLSVSENVVVNFLLP